MNIKQLKIRVALALSKAADFYGTFKTFRALHLREFEGKCSKMEALAEDNYAMLHNLKDAVDSAEQEPAPAPKPAPKPTPTPTTNLVDIGNVKIDVMAAVIPQVRAGLPEVGKKTRRLQGDSYQRFMASVTHSTIIAALPGNVLGSYVSWKEKFEWCCKQGITWKIIQATDKRQGLHWRIESPELEPLCRMAVALMSKWERSYKALNGDTRSEIRQESVLLYWLWTERQRDPALFATRMPTFVKTVRVSVFDGISGCCRGWWAGCEKKCLLTLENKAEILDILSDKFSVYSKWMAAKEAKVKKS